MAEACQRLCRRQAATRLKPKEVCSADNGVYTRPADTMRSQSQMRCVSHQTALAHKIIL